MRHETFKERRCDWPDCPEAGVHRAPKTAESLGEYFWFCLAHVRKYNAEWDFFKGRSAADVEDFRYASMTGHRPTWPLGHGPAGPDWRVEDALEVLRLRPGMRNPFESATKRQRRNTLTPRERRALETLGLDETASVTDIKRRYKLLVKKYHPDSSGGSAMEDRLKRVIQAYSDLKKSGRLAGAEA